MAGLLSYMKGRVDLAGKDDIVITAEGYKKLVEELDVLTNRKRKEVAQRLKDAIGYGDITENSEYDDAKNEQAFIEARIRQLTETLARARVIDQRRTKKADRVRLGLIVTIRNLADQEVNTLLLVGSAEANPKEQKISNESPVGKAIMGKRVGDTVKVFTPQGEIEYEIVDIKSSSAK